MKPRKLTRAKLVATSFIARPRPTVVSHEGSWASEARSHLCAARARLRAGISLAMSACMFAGVKVFTATKAKERESLGEMVTAWLRENPRARIVDKIVTQSSDDQFHCLTITLFYATEE